MVVPLEDWQRMTKDGKASVPSPKTVQVPLADKTPSQTGSGERIAQAVPRSPKGNGEQPTPQQQKGAGPPSPLPPLSPSQGKEDGGKVEEEGKEGNREEQKYVDRQKNKGAGGSWMPPGRRAKMAPRPKKTWISL